MASNYPVWMFLAPLGGAICCSHPEQVFSSARKTLNLTQAAFFRQMFTRVLTSLYNALQERLERHSEQVELYRQLRVLNPNNLPDMSDSYLDYPALQLQEFPEQFAEYFRSQKRDITGPDSLFDWWNAHPPSAFKERVLFLIASPASSASAERFFSMCGQLDEDQWALSQNARRLEFMINFNGDLH